MPRKPAKRNWEVPSDVLSLADEYYRTYLRGNLPEAKRMKRRLVGLIRSRIELSPGNPRLWCILGDLYIRSQKRIECFRRAVKADPKDPEANAELGREYAQRGNRRLYAKHFDVAMKSCRHADIEDCILYACLDAARIVGDRQRKLLAQRTGHRRFPDDSLFKDKVSI